MVDSKVEFYRQRISFSQYLVLDVTVRSSFIHVVPTCHMKSARACLFFCQFSSLRLIISDVLAFILNDQCLKFTLFGSYSMVVL